MEDICSICLLPNGTNFKETICGHKFHSNCLRLYFKNNSKFPNCRMNLNINDYFETCVICSDEILIEIKTVQFLHKFDNTCYDKHLLIQYNKSNFKCPVCIPQIDIKLNSYFVTKCPTDEIEQILDNISKFKYHSNSYKKLKAEKRNKYHEDMRNKYLPKSKKN